MPDWSLDKREEISMLKSRAEELASHINVLVKYNEEKERAFANESSRSSQSHNLEPDAESHDSSSHSV